MADAFLQYRNLTSMLLPDKAFCASKVVKAFAWDFKQDKIVKIASNVTTLVRVDSLETGQSANREVIIANNILKTGSTELKDCTANLKAYYMRFLPTRLCGSGGFRALLYKGTGRAVFEIFENNQKVLTIFAKSDHRSGFSDLMAEGSKQALTKLLGNAVDRARQQLQIKGQGLSGFSVLPKIGSLRFCL